LDYAVELFLSQFPLNEEHRHSLTESSILDFMNKLSSEAINAALSRMVDDGMIQMTFDAESNNFMFSLTEEGKKAAK
jgi:hypothetical protein